MHHFKDSLAASHKASDLPLWEECYRKFFVAFEGMTDYRADGEHQRAGIDRSVQLKHAKQILIDEKVRWRNEKTGKVYEDIALEYWSDEARNTPGWVCKPLRADYIAYAIAPLGRCYLLPVTQLQLAWSRDGVNWIKSGPRIAAPNNGYMTISVGVPVGELFRSIGGALRCRFEPVESFEPPEGSNVIALVRKEQAPMSEPKPKTPLRPLGPQCDLFI